MHEQPTNHDSDQLGEARRLTETRRDQPTVHQLGAVNQEASHADTKYTVQEAAEILGITVDAVRGRIRRGTLGSIKIDGQVYVRLDAVSREQQTDQSPTEHPDSRGLTGDQAQLVESLQERIAASEDQIEWLRREVERKDTIIMQMAQRIPELEAAPESRESPVMASGESSGTTGRGATGQESVPSSEERLPWWRRWFG